MNMMARILMSFALIALLGTNVSAEIYKWVDESGATIYSDTPHPDAEVIKTQDLNTYSPQPIRRSAESAPKKDDVIRYESVTIVEPTNDSAFWSTGAPIAVTVDVQPGLAGAHSLQLFIDGAPAGEPGKSTRFSIGDLDRGTHSVQAKIMDEGGSTVFESPSSSFTVHKQSRLRRN